MTEERTEQSPSEARARAQAMALLARARGVRVEVEQAGNSSTGAQTRLAPVLAGVAAAEIQLALLIDAPAGGRTADMAGFEALLQSTEQAADAAVQAASAAATDGGGDAATITAATRAEVRNLSRDLFEKHIFDRYLHFNSPAEKAAYEAEQTERQRQIAALLAEHTPGADLRAGGLAAGGMLVAADHGATDSPEFLPRWNRLTQQLHKQRELVAATGRPEDVEKFDRQVRDDIRTSLQRRGVPADQIERVLASNDPLHAVTPYLNADHARTLESSLHIIAAREPEHSHPWPDGPPDATSHHATATPAAPPPAPVVSADTKAKIMVSLDALEADGPSVADAGHGLPDQARPPASAPKKGPGGIT